MSLLCGTDLGPSAFCVHWDALGGSSSVAPAAYAAGACEDPRSGVGGVAFGASHMDVAAVRRAMIRILKPSFMNTVNAKMNVWSGQNCGQIRANLMIAR